MASYLALYIYAMVYQIGMTLVVLYTRNVFHLISSILFLIAMAIYSGIQWSELDTTITNINDYKNLFSSATTQIIDATKGAADSINALSIAIIVLACLVCIMQGAIGLKLKDKFQQSTGETIGNSNRLIAANIIFNLHRDALLLAVFFCPAYFLQSIIISPKKDAEFGVSFAAMFISFPIIVFGDYFVCRERKIASAFSFISYILGLIFIVFKIARIYIRYRDDFPGRKSVVAFGVITLLLLSILIALAVLVIKNFGLGLYQIYAKNYNWISHARDKPIPSRYCEGEESSPLATNSKIKESVIAMEFSPPANTHASIVATADNSTHALPQRQEIDF